MPKVNGLTDKQRRFAQEYVIDSNATQAAVRAGYSERTAKQQGQRLLTKVDLKAEIDRLKAEKAEELDLSHERVLRGLLAEAERTGDGTSHAARVSAWTQLGKWRELSMWKDVTEHTGDALGDMMAAITGQARARPEDDDQPTIQ